MKENQAIPNNSLEETVEQAEREALIQAAKLHSSSRKLGAALGLSHTAALNKLKKYGISLTNRTK